MSCVSFYFINGVELSASHAVYKALLGDLVLLLSIFLIQDAEETI